MTKYLQFDPATIDSNGLARISAEVVSTGMPAPAIENQIAVDDEVDTSGKVIDTLSQQLVDDPIALNEDHIATNSFAGAADVDMSAEYQKVAANEAYFLANFVKIT